MCVDVVIVNTVMSYVINLHYGVCCDDVFILSRSFIVNTIMSWVIKLHGQYVLFSMVFLL